MVIADLVNVVGVVADEPPDSATVTFGARASLAFAIEPVDVVLPATSEIEPTIETFGVALVARAVPSVRNTRSLNPLPPTSTAVTVLPATVKSVIWIVAGSMSSLKLISSDVGVSVLRTPVAAVLSRVKPV